MVEDVSSVLEDHKELAKVRRSPNRPFADTVADNSHPGRRERSSRSRRRTAARASRRRSFSPRRRSSLPRRARATNPARRHQRHQPPRNRREVHRGDRFVVMLYPAFDCRVLSPE